MNRQAGWESAARHGRKVYWAAAIALLLGLTALFQSTLRETGGMSLQSDAQGRSVVVLQRHRSGHFLAEGSINAQPVTFLVDTGATVVAVSDQLARQLGLEVGPATTVMTAAGPARGWMTRLDRVQVGTLALHDVSATISPGLGNEVLLGMSFLKHFSLVQEGETLVLTGRGAQS